MTMATSTQWKSDVEFLDLKKKSKDEGWDEEKFTDHLNKLAEKRREIGIRVSPPRQIATPTAKRITDNDFLAIQMRNKAEGWTDDRFTQELMALRRRREGDRESK